LEQIREIQEERRHTINYISNIPDLLHGLPKDFDKSFQHEADCLKVVLGMLNDKQKQNRLVVCKNLKNEAENDRNFFSKVFLLSKMEI
jgi:uncharacterized membrane-anchored protein YhcB (DUF1043 family)